MSITGCEGVAHKMSPEINLVVPGPEQPLVDGIETYFRKGFIPHPSFFTIRNDRFRN